MLKMAEETSGGGQDNTMSASRNPPNLNISRCAELVAPTYTISVLAGILRIFLITDLAESSKLDRIKGVIFRNLSVMQHQKNANIRLQ